MSSSVTKYHHMDDDEFGSESSTLRYGLTLNCGNSIVDSDITLKNNKNIKYINSATYIEHDIFNCHEFESDSDEVITEDSGFNDNVKPTSVTQFKIGKMCIEADQKRRETYKKWLNAVTTKEKEKLKIQQQVKMQEEVAKKLAEDERRHKSQVVVTKWMQEKKVKEFHRKSSLVAESKSFPESPIRNPPVIKKNVDFQQWIQKKNQEQKAKKLKAEEKQKLTETHQKCRNTLSNLSYDKWSRSAQNKPKHVPLNQGLDTLRGSVSKIYINPIPWKNLDD